MSLSYAEQLLAERQQEFDERHIKTIVDAIFNQHAYWGVIEEAKLEEHLTNAISDLPSDILEALVETLNWLKTEIIRKNKKPMKRTKRAAAKVQPLDASA